MIEPAQSERSSRTEMRRQDRRGATLHSTRVGFEGHPALTRVDVQFRSTCRDGVKLSESEFKCCCWEGG